MTERCSTCLKDISEYPQICLDSRIYCFSCAKNIVEEKDRLKEQELKPKMEEYEQKRDQHSTWQQNLNLAIPDKKQQADIRFGAAIVFGVLFGYAIKVPDKGILGLIVISWIVGLIVSHLYVKNKRSEWILQNPEPPYPDFPTLPKSDYARHRIELVGGGKRGREMPKQYRKQILKRDGNKCQICHNIFPEERLEVHHIIPRSQNGKNVAKNLITLCFNCHLDESWFGHKHYMRKWYRR